VSGDEIAVAFKPFAITTLAVDLPASGVAK
jgi:hypothetical protein